MFRVGQKVVCVNAEGMKYGPRKWARLTTGQIYTVRALVDGMDEDGRLWPALLLQEISNPIAPRGVEYNYASCRFRPIVERKTDISVFKAMLTPAGRKQQESV